MGFSLSIAVSATPSPFDFFVTFIQIFFIPKNASSNKLKHNFEIKKLTQLKIKKLTYGHSSPVTPSSGLGLLAPSMQ